MKALFGMVSLLVVMGVVGILVSRQLQVTKLPLTTNPALAASAAKNVRQPSQQLQEQVRSDVVRALEQGARKDEPLP
jgi:uncharacterized protein YceH (UPF0502 family)